MLLQLIATTSADVAATSSRLAKVERIVACLCAAAPEEVAVAVAYLSGELPLGPVGVGWAALRDLRRVPSADLTFAASERPGSRRRAREPRPPGRTRDR